MLRYFFIVFIVQLFGTSGYTQILNANFEEWEIREGIEEPMYWLTTNIPSGEPSVLKVEGENAIEGLYSLKIMNRFNLGFGNIYGLANIYLEVPQRLNRFSAKIKIDSLTPTLGYAGFEFDEIKDGIETQLDFIHWVIPPNGIYECIMDLDMMNSDSLRITIIAGTGLNSERDSFIGHAEMIVDELKLIPRTITSAREDVVQEEYLTIYPNPTSDLIKINVPLGDQLLKSVIYDNTGKLLGAWKKQSEIDLSFLANNTYQIIVYLESGRILTQKVVVQK